MTMKSNLIALLKEKKRNFAEKVADNMEKGLNNELREVCEIGRVLRDVEELSKTQVNYFMSIDDYNFTRGKHESCDIET